MLKKLPKISIITPSLNQSRFIKKTIDSVLSQSYPNLEYIIIDGGSTDGTLEIIDKYRNKLKWISKRDRGQSDAINKGLRMSKGEIVCYLNSDDVLEDDALLKIAEFFAANPQASWVTGKCYIIDEKGNKSRDFITTYKNVFLKYLRSLHTLLVLNYISQPATFWKREILETIGYFDDQFHFSMDYNYWIRIWQIYQPGYIDGYLASFRVHKEAKGSRNLETQLSESYNTATKFTSSKILLLLHKCHDIIISHLYRKFYFVK